MTPDCTLYQIAYSPWSEKARWALDHHRIHCPYVEYLPMVGEPLMRLKLGRWRGKITVPLLVGDGWHLMDGHDIACWADEHGRGDSLRAKDAEVTQWSDLSNTMLAAGRARTTERVAQSDAALLESVPKPINAIGKLSLPVGKYGARYLRRKYNFDEATSNQHLETLEQGCQSLRDALAGGDYLCGDFSFADVAMAVALTFVKPRDDHRIGPESRPRWSEPTICADYPELLEWREAMYAKHRRGYPS